MSNYSEAIEAMNDLIQINNDRIAGYERAIEHIRASNDHSGLSSFQKYLDDSRQFIRDLTQEVQQMGGTPADSSTVGGKVHRFWMDIKNTFSSDEKVKESALESCVFGDDAAIKSYEAALADSTNGFSMAQTVLLNSQLASIRIARQANKIYERVEDAMN